MEAYRFLKKCPEHDVKIYLSIPLPKTEKDFINLSYKDKLAIEKAAMSLDIAYSISY